VPAPAPNAICRYASAVGTGVVQGGERGDDVRAADDREVAVVDLRLRAVARVPVARGQLGERHRGGAAFTIVRCGFSCWSVALVSAARYWTFSEARSRRIRRDRHRVAGGRHVAGRVRRHDRVGVRGGGREPVTVKDVDVLVPTWVVPSSTR
jgi:hypothetical protein